MGKVSTPRIKASIAKLSSLGHISSRTLFGGYSIMSDSVAFAMVSKEQLYLRACEENARYFTSRNLPLLVTHKRGRPLSLNYFCVDDALWNDDAQLITLASNALDAAKKEKQEKQAVRRIKDLPNVTFGLEMMLWEAGIRDIETLKNKGAKACWMILRQRCNTLGAKVLMSLEGAITGSHSEALPRQRQWELNEWAKQQLEQEAKNKARGKSN